MTKPPSLLIDKPELRETVPYSDSTIERLERQNLFPRRITLAPGTRRVFWIRSQIEQWLRDRGIQIPSDASDRADEAAAAGRRRAEG